MRARRLVRRFRRNDDGAYAIEFAFISIPLFLLVFAIIELGLLFLAGHMLDLGVSKASRLIRVGQQPTAATFQDKACDSIGFFMDCNKLQVDVRRYSDFDEFAASGGEKLEMDENGDIDTSYNLGTREEIQLVRVFYIYPMFFGSLIPSNNATGEGRLLSASFVFRNEPW